MHNALARRLCSPRHPKKMIYRFKIAQETRVQMARAV